MGIRTIQFCLNTPETSPSKPDTSLILSSMFGFSTKNHNHEELNQFFDANGINFDEFATSNGLGMTIKCPPEKTVQALKIIKEIVNNSDFQEDDFQVMKSSLKDSYKASSENGSDKINPEISAPDSKTDKETYENLDKITIDDVKNLYKDIKTDSQGYMIITMPNSELKIQQNKVFKELNDGLPKFKQFNSLNHNNKSNSLPINKTKIYREEISSDQAIISQNFKIPNDLDIKNNITLSLLNTLLGGNTQSRIYKDLIQKQGIAYSAYSIKEENGKTGKISLNIETNTKDSPENIEKSLNGFRTAINNLINVPISEEELQSAKNSLKSDMIFESETSEGRNRMIEKGLNSPYGINYLNEELNAIDTVTIDDIQQVARKYLNKPSLIQISADKEAFERNKDFLDLFEKDSQKEI